jgi:hypothetical protein
LKLLVFSLFILINAFAFGQHVIPALPPGKPVDQATMKQIYEEVKTPYKYGLVVIGEYDKKPIFCYIHNCSNLATI